MNNKKLTYIIRENVKQYLTENRESKNINLARKYLKNNGYSDTDAQRILDNIRTDIPNLRLGQCKFLLTACRFYINNDLSDGENILAFNRILQYIASEAHINEYDNNLNGLSLQEIINRFDSVRQQDIELSRKNSYSKQFTKNENYDIVKIPDFKTASQYSDYTSWCVTHYQKMYNNYTNDGVGLFYFCLKKGFENVPKEQGENCPLDEYGLSMIAVSVDEDGELNTITCRWNHDMEGNDHIMTKDELEDLLGINFYETFKPYTEEELASKGKITRSIAVRMLSQGISPYDIFDEIDSFPSEGFTPVRLNSKWSFIDTHSNLIGNGNVWFNDVVDFSNGLAAVKLHNKWSFIDTKGKLINNGNAWFDKVDSFCKNFAVVILNNKWSFIDTKGKLINNGNAWFDCANNFIDGFARVKLDGKWSFIDTDGQLIGNGNAWFDMAHNFVNGFAKVVLNDKCSFINAHGNLLGNGNVWFDRAENFVNGFAKVMLNKKYNFINTNTEIISNIWFDEVYPFKNGFAVVVINNKYNFINIDGKIISKKWFNDIVNEFEGGFAKVKIKNQYYELDTEGNLSNNGTKNTISKNITKENIQLSNNKFKKIIKESIDYYINNIYKSRQNEK